MRKRKSKKEGIERGRERKRGERAERERRKREGGREREI